MEQAAPGIPCAETAGRDSLEVRRRRISRALGLDPKDLPLQESGSPCMRPDSSCIAWMLVGCCLADSSFLPELSQSYERTAI